MLIGSPILEKCCFIQTIFQRRWLFLAGLRLVIWVFGIPKFSRNILRSDLHRILKSMEKVSLQYTDDGSDVFSAEEVEKFKAIYGVGFPNDDFCKVVKPEVEGSFP